MKAGVSIHEVARAAGVSTTTVSHALNGKGRLSAATRERVARVAAELRYQPHAAARNLAEGKTGVIGLAVSQAAGMSFALTDFAYFINLMGAATTTALARGYAPILMPAPAAPGDPPVQVGVDGAIVVDPVAGDPLVARYRDAGVPLVTTGRVLDDDGDGWWVDNDHGAGTTAILEHMERAGARRVALVTGPTVTSYTRDSATAYEAWCAERGAAPRIAVARGDLAEGAGVTAGHALLGGPDPPDAVYATLDRLALGVLRAAEVRGVEVPRDLLLASCTDSDAARLARPSLTALRLQPEEIGRRAIEMLMALLEDRPPAERHVRVRSRVIPRGSTKRA